MCVVHVCVRVRVLVCKICMIEVDMYRRSGRMPTFLWSPAYNMSAVGGVSVQWQCLVNKLGLPNAKIYDDNRFRADIVQHRVGIRFGNSKIPESFHLTSV